MAFKDFIKRFTRAPWALRKPWEPPSFWSLSLADAFWQAPHTVIKTKPTLYLTALFAMLVGLVAYNTGNNLVFMMLSTILGVLTLSYILYKFNLQNFVFRISSPAQVHYRDSFDVQLTLENQNKFRPLFSLSLNAVLADKESFWSEKISPLQAKKAFVVHLGPLSSEVKTITLTASKRGSYLVGINSVASLFPFAFVMKQLPANIRNDILILPRIVAIDADNLPFPPAHGSLATSTKGAGSDLHSLREYRVGDPPRHIHWRLSAKQNRQLLREFAQEYQPTVSIVFDTRGLDNEEPAFEKAVTLAASACQVWQKRGVSIGIWTPDSGYIAPNKTSYHLLGIWRMLANVQRFSMDRPMPAYPTIHDGISVYIDWNNRPVPRCSPLPLTLVQDNVS
ncbi:MAG: DUF58 domain-containing protein [Verrucomicrobiota bacterium]|nr:DUF58 domain-containing protein [Verrucomicrobiota bacterium]